MEPTPELRDLIRKILETADAELEARREAERWAAEARDPKTRSTRTLALSRAEAAMARAKRLAREQEELEAQAVALIEKGLRPTEAEETAARRAAEAARKKARPAVLKALEILRAAGARLEYGMLVRLPPWIEMGKVGRMFDAEPPEGSVAALDNELRGIESARRSHDPFRILDQLLHDEIQEAV